MTLQFAPFASQISTSFWSHLARVKVDQLQLSDESIEVKGRYSSGRRIFDRKSGDYVALPVGFHLDNDSFIENNSDTRDAPSTSASAMDASSIEAFGQLKNFNTIEDYRNADKIGLLDTLGEELLQVIQNDPNPLKKLNSFIVLSFADLKKFKFIYWFAYPALISKPGWQVENNEWLEVDKVFDASSISSIASNISQIPASYAGFFLVSPSGKLDSVMNYEETFRNVPEDKRMVGFIDPSPHENMPGWPLRNLLTLLSIRFDVERIKILCWKGNIENSVICKLSNERGGGLKGDLPLSLRDGVKPSVVGWERNTSGKLGPKLADLGPLMDPKRLADQAVDLNLKLMRWRILPEINLEKIQSTRCLLLGAGTLGCYVARNLLGWGVRIMTLVDSSTVSFSNPVRQPLFEYQDSLNGGKAKAQCAAESLQRIYPGVNAKGVQMSIPMPGHPIPEASVKKTMEDVIKLEELIDDHDVIYLLMDSRESRWLPTVIGAAKGKLVMNTALGFDNFLAMRHGANPSQHNQFQSKSTRLGCYFCNDIVAPTDSLTDRTLDQMCTVTRPGLAAIASAMTVELMVSILQHPKGILAGAYSIQNPEESILGYLPHQLRGSLFQFNTLLIHGPAYEKCTACSQTVLNEYNKDGFQMVQKACNDESYLRSLTGLDKLYDATDEIEVDWSEDEEGGSIKDKEEELL